MTRFFVYFIDNIYGVPWKMKIISYLGEQNNFHMVYSEKEKKLGILHCFSSMELKCRSI